MGVYRDYLDMPGLQNNFEAIANERKKQLQRIADARGHDVFVFAADLNKQLPGSMTAISYVDVLPITDQLSNLTGKHLDLILETPGGLGEVTEEIVRFIRNKYETLSVIVPGWAKSAGTILTMAADEILMGPTSALGPIDAQLFWQGKQFSADALLEGVEKIKKEVQDTGVLNKAYIPILQNLSPGELQDAQNALDFAVELVTDWLARYKFKDWVQHSDGHPVTPEDRKERARGVADQLCDHRKWRTHGRSLKISDLEAMRLKITDYSSVPDLSDSISRYYALLQITFGSNIYKLYETPFSQVVKVLQVQVQQQVAKKVPFNFQCGKCKTVTPMQANVGSPQPLEPGRILFPKDNKFRCPQCGAVHDLSSARQQLEAQTQQPVV